MENDEATANELLEQARAHHRAGRLYCAEPLYRRFLAEQPDHADALHLLGVLAGQTDRPELAVESIERAIQLDPRPARYHANLGKYLTDLGRFADAVTACRIAIGLAPDHAGALNNLAAALNGSGRFAEAALASTQALRANPGLAAAHNNLGNALRGQGRVDEAAAAYRRALGIDPAAAEVHNNLGNVLKDTGEVGAALASYREAVRIRPGFAEAWDHLLNTIHYDPAVGSAEILDEARRWYREQAARLARDVRPHVSDRSPDRRLRVGYVSPDFRQHPVGLNLLPLLRSHTHASFEVFCYAGVAHPDSLTRRFRSLSDGWRDIAGLSHEQVADRVRDDRIDILVDLSLHAAGNRLLVFARRPAPVQVTFAGYPGTTGLETIDYRLTDPYLDPPGAHDECYVEESIRLPDTFWCFDPLADEVPVGPPPAASAGLVTFGCLNNFCKVNDKVLDLWAAVLRELDSSRLLMLSPPGSHRDRVTETLRRLGVAPERITFVGSRPRPEYLQMYDRIDVGLDTLPYNGHTTSLDACWMGVPVVSLAGSTVVGRAGLSQSMNLGLPDLVASTAGEFVRLAAGLARDVDRLATLRSTLRSRMQNSPLMDGPRFARNIEAAYREMWRRWCRR